MATDIRSTPSATFQADDARKTKVDKGTPVPLSRCDEKICAAWGNDIDEKLEQINEVFVDGAPVLAMTIGAGDAAPTLVLDKASGSAGGIEFSVAGGRRWRLEAGTDQSLAVRRFDGSGDPIDAPVSIDWATGAVTFAVAVSFDGNDLTDVGLVDGVDISSHVTRHQPGGADALPTASPTDVSTSNAEGSATSFARSDHVHAIGNNAVGNSALRDSSALSVIGRASNSSGDPADITASSDGQFLSRHSGALAFSAIVSSDLPATADTNARVAVQRNHSVSGTRRAIDFVEGRGTSISASDDSGNERVQVTIANTNVPVGLISPYAGSTAPTGWLLCDGSAVSRSTYADLFAVVGTTFGAGNGTTTFNLPNLVNFSPMGAGSTVGRGSTAGALTTAHTHGAGSYQADSHSHSDGTLSAASHTHGLGTLGVDSHTHGVGSIAAGSHSHGAGTYAAASHTHPLSNDGYALISIDDPNGDVGMKLKTGVGSWADDRQAYGAAGGQIATTWTSAVPLEGDTDAASPSVSGNSGSATPSMSGSTAGGTATISGAMAAATPDVTGSTGSSTATVSGTSSSTSPSVLHPVLGVTYIIYAGV